MFGTSGIRGKVGETVTGSLALDVGRALGSMTDRIVVGRDARDSGGPLARAAIAGGTEAGADVVDIGIESTPTVARSVAWYDADAGLMITASHNPPAYNGFKFWTRQAQAFESEKTATISRRVTVSGTVTVPPDEMGTLHQVSDARRRHLEALSREPIDDLSVVVDIGNGAGQLTADALLALGCDVRTLDAQPDGSFPGRPSEPTAEHCELLSTVVAETDADVGIAHDGDADRMMAVDETGHFVSGDELLALFARETVSEGASIAAPINASALVDAVIGESDGSVVRTAVGDGNVAGACSRPDVEFGGEPSGAWIWPEETRCPDGHYAATRLAELLADGSSTLSERIGEFPTFVTKRESFACENKSAVVAEAETRIHEQYDTVRDIDGVRVDLENGWFLLRASGTEPVVRVTAEAQTEREAQSLLAEANELTQPSLRAAQD